MTSVHDKHYFSMCSHPPGDVGENHHCWLCWEDLQCNWMEGWLVFLFFQTFLSSYMIFLVIMKEEKELLVCIQPYLLLSFGPSNKAIPHPRHSKLQSSCIFLLFLPLPFPLLFPPFLFPPFPSPSLSFSPLPSLPPLPPSLTSTRQAGQ